jgi:hypothetical protein
MAHVSDSQVTPQEVDYEDMSASDLLKQMKDMMKALEKKTKATETKLKKYEEKEEKREKSAPAKGVRPAQLDENNAWVEYVHQHMLANGWKSFTHKERYGKSMAEIEFPESEQVPLPGTEGVMVNVFKGIEPLAQVNLSHAMSVSAKYKLEKPDLYAEWKTEWKMAHPDPTEEEKAASAAAKVKPVAQRVSMTLAEKMAEKAQKEAEKEAEKARKAEERAQKKAEKEAEKEKLKAEKEAAKQLAALNKSVKGGPKAAVLRAAVPVALPSKMMKPALAPSLKPAIKPVVAQPIWVPPTEEGAVVKWTVNGVEYLRNAENFLFQSLPNGEVGDAVGLYNPADGSIDATIKPDFDDEQ